MKYPDNFLSIISQIKEMKIRGAGRIARAAVSALKIISDTYLGKNENEFINYIKDAAKLLINTRPTAVSLPNAVRYVLIHVINAYNEGADINKLKNELNTAVKKFILNSKNAIKKIGLYGAKLIDEDDVILTHCNSAAALSIIVNARKMGKNIHVYATETRPKFQGRITIKILNKYKIKTTLIVDSAVRYFMRNIDKVVVGADAILMDGNLINKIGTSTIALVANEYSVPFYVAAETYKFAPKTIFGDIVTIEERSSEEVLPSNILNNLKYVEVKNPAFDITPAKYISLVISEIGIYSPLQYPYVAINNLGFSYSDKDPWE